MDVVAGSVIPMLPTSALAAMDIVEEDDEDDVAEDDATEEPEDDDAAVVEDDDVDVEDMAAIGYSSSR